MSVDFGRVLRKYSCVAIENPANYETPVVSEKRSTDSMIPSIYRELRQLAAKKISCESADQSLSATALVHEAYLVLAKDGDPRWDNRGHFYTAAAVVMRRVLIDRARRKMAQRRGGRVKTEPLADDSIHAPAAPSQPDELLALNDALDKLTKEDKRKGELVMLRYFVGLSIEEAADALGISKATAKRDWVFSRAWLLRELEES